MRPLKTVLVVAILSIGLGLFSSYYMYGRQPETCALCGIPINPTFEAMLHLKDGTVKDYCCVSCALKAYLELKEKVAWVAVTDQETGEKLNANNVIFVENDIVTCKPCGTRLHIFESESQHALFYESRADKYMKKFGGKIVDNPFLAAEKEFKVTKGAVQ